MPVTGEFTKLEVIPSGMEIAVLPFAKKSRLHLFLFVKNTGPLNEYVHQRLVPQSVKTHSISSKWARGTTEFVFRPGVDHATEHFVYKGSKKKKFDTPIKITRFYRPLDRDDEVGLGAETTMLWVSYYLEVSPTYLKQAMEFLAELTLHPLFLEKNPAVRKRMQKELKKERNVLLEEWAFCEDDHLMRAKEQVRLQMFPGHPLGHPLGGDKEDIRSITFREIAARHQMRYHPSNMLLVVIGGGVTTTVVKKHTDRFFRAPNRRIQQLHAPRPTIRNDVPIEERVKFDPRPALKTYMALGFPFGRPFTHKEEASKGWPQRQYAIWVLKKIFGGRWASRPFIELRETRGLGYRHYSTKEEFPGAGALIYSTHLFPEEVKHALRVLLRIFAKLATQPVGKQELEDAKKSWMEKFDSDAEVPEDIAACAYYGIRLRGRIITFAEMKKAIQAVTAEDVLTAAREIIVPSRLYAHFTGNLPSQKVQREILRMLKNWKIKTRPIP